MCSSDLARLKTEVKNDICWSEMSVPGLGDGRTSSYLNFKGLFKYHLSSDMQFSYVFLLLLFPYQRPMEPRCDRAKEFSARIQATASSLFNFFKLTSQFF